MGLEITEEFWPITPIKTTKPTSRNNYNSTINLNNNDKNNRSKNSNSSINGADDCQFRLPDLKVTREFCVEEDEEKEKEECTTPKSEGQKLKTPLVCPPAPRKTRSVKRKNGFSSTTSHGYFQAPIDLNSVFFSIPTSCKKIKAGGILQHTLL